jgi:hypothetical protein
VTGDLAVALTCRAVEVGFGRLTDDELAEVVRRQDTEIGRWGNSDRAEARFRRRLHAGIGAIAIRAREAVGTRRRP